MSGLEYSSVCLQGIEDNQTPLKKKNPVPHIKTAARIVVVVDACEGGLSMKWISRNADVLKIVIVAVTISGASAQQATIVQPQSFAVSDALRDVSPLLGDAEPPSAVDPVQGVSTTKLLNFDGTAEVAYVYPDANGAAGATQYMQWTNARYTVYSKTTGVIVMAPTSAELLWKNLGGQCATTNAGDGIVNYDKAAQRWIVTHHTGGGVPYTQCVAVSTSSDATGTYYLYGFSLTSTYYPDYPQLGVWPDAYYLTTNLLNATSFTNVSAEICALDRTSMLAGIADATAQCFTTVTNADFSVLQPADLDGATAPPIGSPNYLLALDTNSLDLYKFHVDFVNPANSTFTGPTNIPVTAFTQACSGAFCIPQRGSTEVLDGVGDRLLHRLAYRNFGDHESLVITHSIAAGASVGVRWYEIRSPGATPVVYQQATFAPDGKYRWLGSAAMDMNQDMVVGYSLSSTSTYPSIGYTGRLSTDLLNTMEAESPIMSGTGDQTASGNDWGNASSMSIDPVDDCTFWYTNEYMKKTGTLANTRIASFKFAACK
jgi:hypothetical protein